MKRLLKRTFLLRIGLLLAATAIVLLVVPRADHQSYSYELNQPWKYPLLTAEFDTPILRDSTSIRQMRDSIEANFIPFALKDETTAESHLERFSTSVRPDVSAQEASLLTRLVEETYSDGIASPELYNQIKRGNNTKYRIMTVKAGEPPMLHTYDGATARTQKQAFDHIDSLRHIFGSPQAGTAGGRGARLGQRPGPKPDRGFHQQR